MNNESERADERIQGLRRWCEQNEREIERLTDERDALIEGCITPCQRRRSPRVMASTPGPISLMEHGWEWRYGFAGEFVATKEEAVAAVRRAAGLSTEKDTSTEGA